MTEKRTLLPPPCPKTALRGERIGRGPAFRKSGVPDRHVQQLAEHGRADARAELPTARPPRRSSKPA